MNEISITHTTDESTEFFSQYELLGDLQKEIWKVIKWFVQKFPNAFPSQETIAAKVGCSRKHVNRTFAKFMELGWLHLISRGPRRTKTSLIPHHLTQLNLVKRDWFKRTEVTPKVTHSYPSNRILTSKGNGENFKRKNTTLDPSLLGRQLKMTNDGALKLALLPDAIQHEALRIAKQLGSQGWHPEKPEKYFLGIAFNLAKNQGLKIDWISYYAARRKYE